MTDMDIEALLVNRPQRLTVRQKAEQIQALLVKRPDLSDRGVASIVGVAVSTVGVHRRRLVASGVIADVVTRHAVDGRKVNTSRIGKRTDEPVLADV